MISAGRVAINGRVAHLGDRADPYTDQITVDGVPLPVRPDATYYLVNKSRGVISTSQDPQGRPTVMDLVPSEPRVFSVGRLDADTTGLLVLTNDGTLADRLTHPRYGITKTYVALVTGAVTDQDAARLVTGVDLEDGPAAAQSARVLDRRRGRSRLEVVMLEGRNREVRRMLDAIGHPVLALHRVAIAGLRDASLKPGAYRTLRVDEVRDLYRATGATAADRATDMRSERGSMEP